MDKGYTHAARLPASRRGKLERESDMFVSGIPTSPDRQESRRLLPGPHRLSERDAGVPSKLSASGWDLVSQKHLPTTGFSGTVDSRDLLPLTVHALNLDEQRHTNALVLGHLLHHSNAVAPMPRELTSARLTDAGKLLHTVERLHQRPEVILDVGAHIELDNQGVASLWLRMRQEEQGVIFVNDNDEIVVLDRQGNCEPLQTSSFAARTGECLVFLDEAHTRRSSVFRKRDIS